MTLDWAAPKIAFAPWVTHHGVPSDTAAWPAPGEAGRRPRRWTVRGLLGLWGWWGGRPGRPPHPAGGAGLLGRRSEHVPETSGGGVVNRSHVPSIGGEELRPPAHLGDAAGA